MKLLLGLFCCFLVSLAFSQSPPPDGIIAGNVVDVATGKPLPAATVLLKASGDSALVIAQTLTDMRGEFSFNHLSINKYSLAISHSGYTNLRIDSIHIRKERLDFNLTDIGLSLAGKDLSAVIIYAEKPLFENKDGNITFNVGESALSASSSTTELLKQTPLVSVDSDGKILMKGKEVKILIDDKPVEMDARQLQDLLESMPGSMIEKIEVLTTPPPQYANERGGVINIVTKKGKVGMSGRLNVNYGTRGEMGTNASFNYRKNKLSLIASAGISYNRYRSQSYSNRVNTYPDSSNYFNTAGLGRNEILRPTSRVNIDYELNKKNALSLTGFFNSNTSEGATATSYSNLNRYEQLYRLSQRQLNSEVANLNPSANLSYTHKGKRAGEVFRAIAAAAYTTSDNNRNFYQQYLQPDGTFNGVDSTQTQYTQIQNKTFSLRLNYDKPLKDKKTQLNFGGTSSFSNTHNNLLTTYLSKPTNSMLPSDLLSNDFEFYQAIFTLKAAVRYQFTPNIFSTVGVQQEYANTWFDILNNSNQYRNSNWSMLPFANFTMKWDSGYSLTASYRRSVQRPGINQLNPSIDYADPYNTRFGNPYLQPYFSDNFDLGTGYWTRKYNLNFSVGYNALQAIYSSIRKLQSDGTTFTSWENLSGRREYEASIWGGLNLGKKLKLNASSRYAYNVYSRYDREFNRFRNAASLNTTLNGNYQWSTLLNITGNFTYHRFATPQGSARNNLSMNIGAQRKFFQKNLVVSLNVVDPFRQQQNRNFIQAPNYYLESFSTTNSRNLRLTAGYTFKKKVKKKKK